MGGGGEDFDAANWQRFGSLGVSVLMVFGETTRHTRTFPGSTAKIYPYTPII